MNRSMGVRMTALLLGGMLLMPPMTSQAATRPINSVSIKVSSGLEAGDRLSSIEIGSGSASKGKVKVDAGNSKYKLTKAEWVDSSGKDITAGDEPRLKVTLEPEDISEFYFLASYKDSSVKISSGSFVSARRDGDKLVVTLRTKPVKGDYDPPLDAFWYEQTLGEARWEKPENTSGYYEVQLYRDEKSVFKVPMTSANRYNFYPYMTKKGDYTFKVRTIPGTDAKTKHGGKSDWIESGDLQITDRYVSDGKGQQIKDSTVVRGTQETIGWIQDGNNWSYRFPDGALCRGKWECINGLWYCFDVEGMMRTGWQQMGNEHYYLYPDGQMAVGWACIDGKWYYFDNGQEAPENAGCMADYGWKVIGTHYYYFNEDGSMYTGWLSQHGKWYYLNTVDNSLLGAMFTGWIKRDDKTYFADSGGVIVDGWCQIDGHWYYFYPGSGEMACDTSISGFYVGPDGSLQ